MATYQAVKKAVTITPTVRTLSSGVPYAPLLNLAAKAPHDPHSHHHGQGGARSDVAPRWAGGVSRTSSSLISKTLTTGIVFYYITSKPTPTFDSSPQLFPLPTSNNGSSIVPLLAKTRLKYPTSLLTERTRTVIVPSLISWLVLWESSLPLLQSPPCPSSSKAWLPLPMFSPSLKWRWI